MLINSIDRDFSGDVIMCIQLDIVEGSIRYPTMAGFGRRESRYIAAMGMGK